MKRKYTKEIIFLLITTLVLVAIDQATKCYIVRSIKGHAPIILIENFLDITYVLNPGAAFGFLAGANESLRHMFFLIITIAASIFIVYMFFTIKVELILSKIGLTLILSGAIGNLVDRLRLKAVIDFIYVHYHDLYWPAFNVADSLITIGVALMAIDIIKHREKTVGGTRCGQ